MRRVTHAVAALAALLAYAAYVEPAEGQHGNGLYEPFPKAAVKQRAKRFVERLPGRSTRRSRFTDLELARGVFVSGGLRRQRALPASARAGGGSDGSFPLPLEVLLVLLAAGAAPALRLGRARGGATGT